MKQSVIVIGSGITGVSCAEELRRSGAKVTLIDRVKAGDPSQTSFGNAGILAREGIMPIANPSMLKMIPQILLSPSSPVYLKWSYLAKFSPWALQFIMNGTRPKALPIILALNELIYDTVENHIQLSKNTDAARFIEKGDMTLLYRNRKQFSSDKFANQARRNLGIIWEELSRNELLDRDPHISKLYQFGLAYKNHGWITNPAAYVSSLAKHFQKNGGKILIGEVSKINGNNVELKGGIILKAENIVLATGAWSKNLTSQLGHNIPLQAERGYHLSLKNASHMPPNTYLITDKKFGLTPMDGFLRCAGQSEFAPLEMPPNPKAIKNLRKFLFRLYPKLAYETETIWQGTRPTLPDSLPVIGRSSKNPSVIFAFGGQHLGLTMGPKIGKMVRDIIFERQSNINMKPYSSDRFG
ncbi:FAD-binding oxidoreductase [Amylibacter sp.]|jgi:D-amino-acid dehydrogenase|nr:oxidoreductase, FAD-binding protein [alpha proteobacterium HTCC2255] [Rhodobacterales bacterium HTCC2255]MDB2524873.1 FAD-binding oxidoreductase [Amylibacter sp.]MDB2538424.1 FAD-binding oxidoreductase [Amylibacter sp.]